MQATKRPWVVDECPDAQGFCTIRIADGSPNGDTESQPVATVYEWHDAALVVKAANCHDALVTALKNTRIALRSVAHICNKCANGGLKHPGRSERIGEHKAEERRVRDIARAALKTAGIEE